MPPIVVNILKENNRQRSLLLKMHIIKSAITKGNTEFANPLFLIGNIQIAANKSGVKKTIHFLFRISILPSAKKSAISAPKIK